MERKWTELPDGHPVFINPTPDDFRMCAGRQSTVPGFVDDRGNVFIWPANSYGLHLEVAKAIRERMAVTFYVHYYPEGWTVEPAENSLAQSLIGYNVPRAIEMLDNNPRIARMLGNNHALSNS